MYVFDDTDPAEASYIGMANISMIQLAHDKQVKGAFQLHAVRYGGGDLVQILFTFSFNDLSIPFL